MLGYPDKIFLIGFMGVGKSHWGRHLAIQLGHAFIDLDEEISRAAGDRSITQIFEEEGEEYFRRLESDCLEKFTAADQRLVMACGGGTPCFLNNLERMKKVGKVIWLQASVTALLPRLLAEREKRPLIRDLSEAELRHYITKKMGDRQLFYREANLTVAESELTEKNLTEILFHE